MVYLRKCRYTQYLQVVVLMEIDVTITAHIMMYSCHMNSQNDCSLETPTCYTSVGIVFDLQQD